MTTNTICIYKNTGIFKVPLRLSKLADREELKERNLQKTHHPFDSPMSPDKLQERAIHIFEAAFPGRFDPFYRICQAFVSYLLFSIMMSDKATKPSYFKP